MIFELFLTLLAFIAGAVASIAGFGIGSLLTPMLTLKVGEKLAVAAISISHFLGTSFRFWNLKGFIDRKAFIHFGILIVQFGILGLRYVQADLLFIILSVILIIFMASTFYDITA